VNNLNMKYLSLIPVVMAMTLTGCLKLDETLTLEKNGAGNIDILYTIPEQTVSQMKAMFKLRDQMDSIMGQSLPLTFEDEFQRTFFDPTEDRIKQLLKKYESCGVSLETAKVITKNAARTVTIRAAFADLERVAKADFFREHGFTLVRNQNETYTFYRVPESTANGYQPINIGPEASRLISPVMSGLRVSLKVNTPGKIVDTNASRKAPYNAAWIYDFDKDPNALKALQSQAMKIVFEGKNIRLPEVRQILPPSSPSHRH